MKSRALAIDTITATATIAEGEGCDRDGTLASTNADFYGFAQYNAVSGDLLAVGTAGDFTGIVGAVAVTEGQLLKIASGLLVDATAGTENFIALEAGDVGDKILVNIITNNRF